MEGPTQGLGGGALAPPVYMLKEALNQYSALTVQDDTAEEEEANESTQQSEPCTN